MGPPHKSYFHSYREMGDISINGYGRGLFYFFPEERGIYGFLLKSGEFSGFMRKILYKLIIDFSWLRNSVGSVGVGIGRGGRVVRRGGRVVRRGGRGVQRRRRRNRTQNLFHS